MFHKFIYEFGSTKVPDDQNMEDTSHFNSTAVQWACDFKCIWIIISLSATSSVQPVSEPTTNALVLYDFWRNVDRSNKEHYAAEIDGFMPKPVM